MGRRIIEERNPDVGEECSLHSRKDEQGKPCNQGKNNGSPHDQRVLEFH